MPGVRGWVEAEEKLKVTPPLIKTASGYVQQSPWLAISNKQMELMGRYMSELGITPAARSRVHAAGGGNTVALNIISGVPRVDVQELTDEQLEACIRQTASRYLEMSTDGMTMHEIQARIAEGAEPQ